MEDIDSVDIVASALSDFAAGKITWDEVDMRLHDKRYHPHGYKEGDTCKYRDGSTKRLFQDSEIIDKHYSRIEVPKEELEIQRELKSEFNVSTCYVSSADELLSKCGFRITDAMELQDKGMPTPYAVHLRNLNIFYKTVSDMKMRFPRMNLQAPFLISWQIKDKSIYGYGSLDKRSDWRTSFLSFGDLEAQGLNVSRQYHTVRHEIGHNLATSEIRQMWEDMKKRMGSPTAYEKMIQEELSPYAVEGGDEEAIAEAFAIYTSPNFDCEGMDAKLKKIVRKMLGETSKMDANAMDGGNDMLSTKRKGVLPIDAAYMGSYDFPPYGKGRIGWYDNKKGWVEFSTHEERLRYILDRKFRVPSEWIDAICDRFPNKEWSMIEIEWIASEYRETNKELGALLEEIEGWE